MSQCAYTVTVTCTTAPSEQLESRTEVKLTETDLGLGLLISPNPATSQVTFRMEGVGEKGGDLTVFDPLGRMVWEQSVTAQQQQVVLELSQFATGAYQVRLRTENGMVTKGLVVSKL